MAGTNVSFTYNGVTIGGNNFARQLGDFTIEETYASIRFDCFFTLQGSSVAALAIDRDIVTAALIQFSKDFSLTNGVTVLYAVDESAKTTGYNGRPVLRLLSTDNDHETRQSYAWSCEFKKPADSVDDDGGRLASTTSVTKDAVSYNTITVTGTYTCLDLSKTSVQQYLLKAETYVNTILTAVGGSQYKVVEDTYQFDDESAMCNFRATRRQVKVPENAAGTFETGIKEQNISITQSLISDLGLPKNRVNIVQANYSALLDTEVVAHTGQKTFYLDTILPNMLLRIDEQLSGYFILMNHQETFRLDGSSVTVQALGISLLGYGELLEYDRTVSYKVESKKEFAARWRGIQHDYLSSTPSPMITAVVEVQEKISGPPRFLGMKEFLKTGFPTSPEPFDYEAEFNFFRPGAPPFGDVLSAAGSQSAITRINAVAGSAASGAFSSPGGAGGVPVNVFHAYSVERTPVNEDIDQGTPAEFSGNRLQWIFVGATCESNGRFYGHNDERTAISAFQPLISETVYRTEWLWGLETEVPIPVIITNDIGTGPPEPSFQPPPEGN